MVELGYSIVAIALWSYEKLTGPKQTARFLGGGLLVSLSVVIEAQIHTENGGKRFDLCLSC